MAVPISTPSDVNCSRAERQRRMAARRRRKTQRLVIAVLAVVICVGAVLTLPAEAPEKVVANKAADETALPVSLLEQAPDLLEAPLTAAVADSPAEPAQMANQAPEVLANQSPAVAASQNAPTLYYAQSGDSLDVLALRFGVPVNEISSTGELLENGFISEGQLLLIPAQLENVSDSLRLFPDAEVVNSPSALDFDVENFIAQAGGKLADYQESVYANGIMNSAQIIRRVARDYSIHPRLLLALLEYESGWVYGSPPTQDQLYYPLGLFESGQSGLYKQLVLAAGNLGTGYYGWREGTLLALTFPDGSSLRLAPELNCATVAWMYYFAQTRNQDAWSEALYSDHSLLSTYEAMFGNPWLIAQQYASLFNPGMEQPPLDLPFESGIVWSYTSGPHAAWGAVEVRAALDFAPPADAPGCLPNSTWITAAASGLVVRSDNGTVVVDMDGDGNEETGWNIVYLHVGTTHRIKLGTWVEKGDRIGHPSCEGGISTGTHLHIVRKYNGEWIPADGPLAFKLSGWTAKAASVPYQGWLISGDKIVKSNRYSSTPAHISRGD